MFFKCFYRFYASIYYATTVLRTPMIFDFLFGVHSMLRVKTMFVWILDTETAEFLSLKADTLPFRLCFSNVFRSVNLLVCYHIKIKVLTVDRDTSMAITVGIESLCVSQSRVATLTTHQPSIETGPRYHSFACYLLAKRICALFRMSIFHFLFSWDFHTRLAVMWLGCHLATMSRSHKHFPLFLLKL